MEQNAWFAVLKFSLSDFRTTNSEQKTLTIVCSCRPETLQLFGLDTQSLTHFLMVRGSALRLNGEETETWRRSG